MIMSPTLFLYLFAYSIKIVTLFIYTHTSSCRKPCSRTIQAAILLAPKIYIVPSRRCRNEHFSSKFMQSMIKAWPKTETKYSTNFFSLFAWFCFSLKIAQNHQYRGFASLLWFQEGFEIWWISSIAKRKCLFFVLKNENVFFLRGKKTI